MSNKSDFQDMLRVLTEADEKPAKRPGGVQASTVAKATTAEGATKVFNTIQKRAWNAFKAEINAVSQQMDKIIERYDPLIGAATPQQPTAGVSLMNRPDTGRLKALGQWAGAKPGGNWGVPGMHAWAQASPPPKATPAKEAADYLEKWSDLILETEQPAVQGDYNPSANPYNQVGAYTDATRELIEGHDQAWATLKAEVTKVGEDMEPIFEKAMYLQRSVQARKPTEIPTLTNRPNTSRLAAIRQQRQALAGTQQQQAADYEEKMRPDATPPAGGRK